MRKPSVIFVFMLIVLGAASFADAQCGDPSGEWAFGPTEGVAGNGTTAVFGSGRVVRVADITDPSSPTVVAEISAGGLVRGIAVHDNIAYVSASESGLIIIDISDPSHASQVGTWPTEDMVINVAVEGQRAYVANRGDGLFILDISDPTNPFQLGAIDPGGNVWDVAVQGETAFVGDAHNGLHVIDIADETDPQLLSTLTEAGRCYAIDLSDDGNHAFVADYFEGLRVVDVSDPTSPTLSAFVEVNDYASDIRVDGTYAYLGNRSYGTRIYDISDQTNPVEVRRIDNDGSTLRLSLHENLAFLANHDAGLRVVDITVPTEAVEIGYVEGKPELRGPALEGSLAVVAANRQIVVLDVSDPAQPVEVVTVNFDGYASKTAIDGDVVYVASSNGGLKIFDISDPENPNPLGAADAPGAYDLVLGGDFVFLGCSSEGLRVLDVSDPTTPVVVGILEDISIQKSSLALSGNTLFIRDHNVGVHLIDVSNPSAPMEISLFPTGSVMSRPAVQGNTMFVAESGHGVRIVDISDLTAPTEIGAIYETRFPYGLAPIGQLLFIADIYDGSFVVDVSNPVEPSLLASASLATTEQGEIGFDGPLVVVSERRGGAEVFDLAPCFSEPPVADFTWSPTNPEAGRQVQLTDTSIGTIDTRQWSFDDGTSSSERYPTHVWTQAGTFQVTLTVDGSMGSSSITKTVTVVPRTGDGPPITEPGDFAYVVAAAAHAPGLEGTRWVTDVVLHNPGVETAEAFLWFMISGQDNTGAEGVTMSVAPGASQMIEDVVLSMFGEDEAAGGLLIGSDQRLVVTSRTYNDALTGTFGQFIPGRAITRGIVEDEVVHLIQLSRTQNFRTNLGVANPTPETVRVVVSLRDSDGQEINSRTLNVPPFGYVQKTDILGLDVKDAFAVVSSSTAGASYFPYASVVDNRTGDPMMIEPIEPDQDFLVSASAHVGGLAGTDWRTDLEIFNPQSEAVDLQINLLISGEDNTSPSSMTRILNQGNCIRMADILDALFSYGGTAALEVHSLSGDIVVSSRTFNTTDEGTYGQFVPGVGSGTTIFSGQEARLVQLAQDTANDTGFRTNIGFVNRSSTTTAVTTDLFTSAGAHLGTVTTRLDPYEHRQINRIFRQTTSAQVENGYAIVTTSSADGSFVAYASVVDNASGDPIFIPATTVSTEPLLFELLTTGAGSDNGNFGTQDDLNAGCTSWAGATASVADWNDVVSYWQATGESFADDAWIHSGRSYLVQRDGESFRSGTAEHFLIARNDGDLPDGFESLDDVGDHFIDLGAEEDVVHQILCRRPLE